MTPLLWVVAVTIAQAISFIATFDVIPPSAVPRSSRAMVALLLVPLLLAHQSTWPAHAAVAPALLGGIVRGALFGASASVVAAAARLAGSMIDNTLAAGLFAQGVFVGAGPFGMLYSFGFVFVFISSGALAHLVALFATTNSQALPVHTAHIAVVLVRTCTLAGLQLAAPALLVQTLAALLAGTVARIAPYVNGMLLTAPLTSVLVLLTFASTGALLWPALLGLSAAVVSSGVLIAR